ncbi:unnamed protein product [Symbiodinium natans]|uniref:N-acetyltransferase domain-containing protein n=1 Tax=Symbiodinium natans TaxID=878477 RepID=A0A812NMF4_9DINO|nr:unnamed protein product [Symbiodinium natans]
MGLCVSKPKRWKWVASEALAADLPEGIIRLNAESPPQQLERVKHILTSAFLGSTEKFGELGMEWMHEKWLRPDEDDELWSGPLRQDPGEKAVQAWGWCVEFCMQVALRKGALVVASMDEETNQIAAAAVAFPPNDEHMHDPGFCLTLSIVNQIGYPPACMKESWYKARTDACMAAMKRAHNENASGPHWYLQFVGVAADIQGRGHGKKLLLLMNSLADADNVPAYLEASGERNEGLYQHFGYVARNRYVISGKKIERPMDLNGGVMAMVREPNAGTRN